MSDDSGPIRAFLGVYEVGTHDVIVPIAAIRAADQAIEAERARRRQTAEVEAAKAAALGAKARERGLWRRALRALGLVAR